MERIGKRQRGLTALFWSFLLTSALAVLLVACVWWSALTGMMRTGFILPANAAANDVEATRAALHAVSGFDQGQISSLYRWARFSAGGELLDSGTMEEEDLQHAGARLSDPSVRPQSPYSQYFEPVQLADGTVCVLQYDYAVRYGDPALRKRLPDFQLCAALVLLLLWLTVLSLCPIAIPAFCAATQPVLPLPRTP